MTAILIRANLDTDKHRLKKKRRHRDSQPPISQKEGGKGTLLPQPQKETPPAP